MENIANIKEFIENVNIGCINEEYIFYSIAKMIKGKEYYLSIGVEVENEDDEITELDALDYNQEYVRKAYKVYVEENEDKIREKYEDGYNNFYVEL